MTYNLFRPALFLLTLSLHVHCADLTPGAAPPHRFSTLFTAHDVKNHLSTPEGRERAIHWCRETAVSKVYIESFRDGYQASGEMLQTAAEAFRTNGFEVSGCVTTTQVGKKSSGWNLISCYTDETTQKCIREIFEFTAGLFDEIMIDDFWFTDCACADCEAARDQRTVRVGGKSFPVQGSDWEAYRCELMTRLSQEYVLGAARRVNPKVRVIIKYPQWYARFHERGYEVLGETAEFDRIWVGTETRDYNDKRWGGTPQYEGYFIMRWLGGIGGTKCGGGWYDWLGTTEKTYIEQARQTVLGGARESLLFCYGGLQTSTGPSNIAALRREIPELQRVAAEVQRREPLGLAAYKPASSHPGSEARVYDFVGMLGIPLVPVHLFPTNASAAFFPIHSLRDETFKSSFAQYVRSGKTALITDGLAQALGDCPELRAKNVVVLRVKGDPKGLLSLPEDELDKLRQAVLKEFALELRAPNRLAFLPFRGGSWVLENFNDEPARVEVNGRKIEIPGRGWALHWQ